MYKAKTLLVYKHCMESETSSSRKSIDDSKCSGLDSSCSELLMCLKKVRSCWMERANLIL